MFFCYPLTITMQVAPKLCEEYRITARHTILKCDICARAHPCVACPLKRAGTPIAPQFDMLQQKYLCGDRARIRAQRGQPAAEFLERCGWGPLAVVGGAAAGFCSVVGVVTLLGVMLYHCAC